MLSLARKSVALFVVALFSCACGDDAITEKKIAGGQTGGEYPHGGEPPGECVEKMREDIAFEAEGPAGVSAKQALEVFAREHVADGQLETQSGVTFRSSLGYDGRTQLGCGRLFIDANWRFSADNGAFQENVPVTLEVYSLTDATLSATVPIASLQGSYRERAKTLASSELYFSIEYLRDSQMKGRIYLFESKPSSESRARAIAEFGK